MIIISTQAAELIVERSWSSSFCVQLLACLERGTRRLVVTR